MKYRLLCAMLLWLLASSLAHASPAGQVYGATFPSTYLIYALSPDLLAGWNGPLRPYEKKYIPVKYHDLPILGGWYGQGFIPDRELLRSTKIDTVFWLYDPLRQQHDIARSLESINLPLTIKKVSSLADYATVFRELGQEFGLAQRGEALAAYTEKTLEKATAQVTKIPENERLRVFISQDVDGLTSSCGQTARTEMLTLAGGINVLECDETVQDSHNKISFEQVLLLDPDVILILHPIFMQNYSKDTKWHSLRAPREGKVFYVPHEPFNWMDRPATYMRLIGIKWLFCKLYPDNCTEDIVQETDQFMQLFFDLNLDEAAILEILKE